MPQFTDYTEICEECGLDVDPSELRAHPDADDTMEHPQYICSKCRQQLETDALFGNAPDSDQESLEEEAEASVYDENWDTDVSSR